MGLRRFKFPKEARLRGKKEIDTLFQEGFSIYQYPYKVFFSQAPENEQVSLPPQILISVPKKIFKRANDRNLIKRRIKEAWRVSRNLLANPEFQNQYRINRLALIYTAKEPLALKVLHLKLFSVWNRFTTDAFLKK